MNQCIWCLEEIDEDATMCASCSYEAMDDIERGEYNNAFYDEEDTDD
jgi:hypothetical protein